MHFFKKDSIEMLPIKMLEMHKNYAYDDLFYSKPYLDTI